VLSWRLRSRLHLHPLPRLLLVLDFGHALAVDSDIEIKIGITLEHAPAASRIVSPMSLGSRRLDEKTKV
jgi:hypothetical protein